MPAGLIKDEHDVRRHTTAALISAREAFIASVLRQGKTRPIAPPFAECITPLRNPGDETPELRERIPTRHARMFGHSGQFDQIMRHHFTHNSPAVYFHRLFDNAEFVGNYFVRLAF